jgi:hypothetical protein
MAGIAANSRAVRENRYEVAGEFTGKTTQKRSEWRIKRIDRTFNQQCQQSL